MPMEMYGTVLPVWLHAAGRQPLEGAPEGQGRKIAGEVFLSSCRPIRSSSPSLPDATGEATARRLLARPLGPSGDFLSTALLVKDIVAASDDGRGPARKYQDLLRGLDALSETTKAVEQLYRGPAACGVLRRRLRHGPADGGAGREVPGGAQSQDAQICVDPVPPGWGGGSGGVAEDFARKVQFKAPAACCAGGLFCMNDPRS